MSPEGTRVWRKTRRKARRGVPTGRHRRPTEETSMPVQPAASLPLHDYRSTAELEQAALKPAFDPPADPYREVQCGFCNAIDIAANMTDVSQRPRCSDDKACVARWADGAKPVSLVPHAAEALEPLPEPEAAADAAEQAATQALARWAPGETLSDEEQAQAEIRREAIEALRGPLADPAPVADETGTTDGGEAE